MKRTFSRSRTLELTGEYPARPCYPQQSANEDGGESSVWSCQSCSLSWGRVLPFLCLQYEAQVVGELRIAPAGLPAVFCTSSVRLAYFAISPALLRVKCVEA